MTWQLSVLITALLTWQVAEWRHDAKAKKALEAVQEQARADLDALQIKLDKAAEERFQLSADLAAERMNIKVKYRTITQEVPRYVPANTETCNYDLSPDLVRLLNQSARGTVRGAEAKDTAAGQLSGIMSGQPADLAGGEGG